MRDSLTTEELGWVLGRSAESIRDAIKSGEIEGARIPQGFRIPKAEALRLARDKVTAEDGPKLPDRDIERLVDAVIATNEAAT